MFLHFLESAWQKRIRQSKIGFGCWVLFKHIQPLNFSPALHMSREKKLPCVGGQNVWFCVTWRQNTSSVDEEFNILQQTNAFIFFKRCLFKDIKRVQSGPLVLVGIVPVCTREIWITHDQMSNFVISEPLHAEHLSHYYSCCWWWWWWW